MLKVTRAKDLAAEEMDERCYFPLTNVDLLLPKKYEEDEPLIKRTYTVCDKESFLDWGLSSDYQMDEGEEGEDGSKHRTRDRSARPEQPDVAPLIRSSSQYSELSLPSAAQVRTFPAPPLHLPLCIHRTLRRRLSSGAACCGGGHCRYTKPSSRRRELSLAPPPRGTKPTRERRVPRPTPMIPPRTPDIVRGAATATEQYRRFTGSSPRRQPPRYGSRARGRRKAFCQNTMASRRRWDSSA